MSNVRLSRSLCAVVGSVLAGTGSHTTLDALFKSAGAPGDPLNLAHHSKWKEWLFRAGQDSSVDSLAVLGNVLEEFMDMARDEWDDDSENWQAQRGKIETELEQNGLRYFRFGRVLPQGQIPSSSEDSLPRGAPLNHCLARITPSAWIVWRCWVMSLRSSWTWHGTSGMTLAGAAREDRDGARAEWSSVLSLRPSRVRYRAHRRTRCPHR